MRKKIRVQTKKGFRTLLLDKEEEKGLERELKGHKGYIQEYKTKKGKVVTNREIISKA